MVHEGEPIEQRPAMKKHLSCQQSAAPHLVVKRPCAQLAQLAAAHIALPGSWAAAELTELHQLCGCITPDATAGQDSVSVRSSVPVWLAC